MMILIEITGVMAHSSGINNSISFFYAHLPLKKASLLILHWWLCTFDPIMCKWILKKKEKEQNPAVDFHQNICQQTQRWAEREHRGLSDPSPAALMDTAIYL